MKKYSILYIMLSAVLAVSCDVEENLKPSNLDEDRVASQLDLTIPTVKNLYENYNTGVLYEYDNVMDFAYEASTSAASDRWGSVEIPMLRTLFENEEGQLPAENVADYKAYTTEAVNFLNDNVFKYFIADSRIAAMMPYKVLISESIFSDNKLQGEVARVIIESDSRQVSSPENSLKTVYNSHSIVFNLNLDNYGTASRIDAFSKDNFYVLLSRIMGMHNLYDEVPSSFSLGKDEYYGLEMEPVFREETGIADEKLVFVIDKDWFYEKGFIDAKYFYDSEIGTIQQNYDEDGNYLGVIGRIYHYNAIAPSDEFVASKELDVRSYLNEMIHNSSAEITAYPQNIQDNMKILLDLFVGWGVDMLSVNPDLEVLN
ncbi:hypothetical protein [Aestuariibaculum lutulentum]|uniref:Uncharacterized protein n=1 Tax=Aestuariibaculum lutulentum TaxID=2920935 RepID=A0ABS9RG28_9FLAO|nr:hypothetical protein [Aestuariibaculum lutulentum]MCH4551456.1 hypothetical protein [Aestuariibaculum lutulentum]